MDSKDKIDSEKILYKIYYTDLNFDGVDELYRKAKLQNKNIKKDDVREWLKRQSVTQQTQAQPQFKKTEFKPIYSDDIYSYQLDLTFLPKYKYENDKKYVLFTAININSRYAYAYYSKNKKTESIIKMLDKFLDNANVINTVTCDMGSEYTNDEVKAWFKKHEITVFYVLNDSHKLGIINRFHRTLKSKLNKYFIANNTVRWIDVIDKIILNYNNTINTGIGYTPKQASNHMIQSILINEAIDKTKRIENDNKEENINIGDRCRLLNKTKLFDKQQSKYSNEIYTITKIKKNTVDVKNNKDEKLNVKKTDILIVKEVDYEILNDVKPKVEKEYKIKRVLKKEGIKEEDIILNKRQVERKDYKKINKEGL
jgi:hypothetical protein